MASTYVNTRFIITNNQTDYPENQVWVTFAGTFTNTGVDQTIGSSVFSSFGSTWNSYSLSQLSAVVNDVPYLQGSTHYTFSLNGFSGRIYINYGAAALTVAPNPGAPGTSPYLVFEPTVDGLTQKAPTPSASNMDLSYVDGVSGAAGTMIRNATTGEALQATSVNPVTAHKNILANVTALVPTAAQVLNGTTVVRIMSSAASPSSYHSWSNLIAALQTSTASTPLNVCSYTSPTAQIPASFALAGALFGYSGAAAISGQAPGFETMQNYTMTAKFMTNLNPSNTNTVLQAQGITDGTAGVVISGSGTASGSFAIYITNANMEAGTGIYGNNPAYTVMYPATGTNQTAYSTVGIVNDLGGRIVGDLMAGMVFGWAASSKNIVTHAANTNTNLYGVTFSADTVSGISTGELFFLLSLAGAQGKLTEWIGPGLDSNGDNYDVYLYAIAKNSEAYGSGFTDRLQGYMNPDTYWYTANPPAIPGGGGNYEVVGFVNLYLGPCETAGMRITLSNSSASQLKLKGSSITGSDSAQSLSLPASLAAQGSGTGDIPASVTPYMAVWTYATESGDAELAFSCSVSGASGISIVPSKNGTATGNWQLGESPALVDGVWEITFTYSEN
ncbi:MAG: hypothetical protein KF744_16480 [Taibaiella sp.]|nr:hypothetical protein [Taibaiella sp.]